MAQKTVLWLFTMRLSWVLLRPGCFGVSKVKSSSHGTGGRLASRLPSRSTSRWKTAWDELFLATPEDTGVWLTDSGLAGTVATAAALSAFTDCKLARRVHCGLSLQTRSTWSLNNNKNEELIHEATNRNFVCLSFFPGIRDLTIWHQI